ncbi:MAG TPA: EAL domain-containing protein [Gammaproteobacteria bacterium]|nr:EAL domain-containing protein [Gammaproteobacteria bacterium]
MLNKRLTLQKMLALVILLVGIIGIGLVIATDFTYRKLAHEQQKDAITHLIALKSSDLIEKSVKLHEEIAERLQDQPAFIQALHDNDRTALSRILDAEFDRYYVTTGLLKLEKILVFRPDFSLLADSTRGIALEGEQLPCSRQISQFQTLPALGRIKPDSQLCEYSQRPLLGSLFPIGKNSTEAYIQIISDPAHSLSALENELGIPLKIYSSNDRLLYQSASWPASGTLDNYLLSGYQVHDRSNRLILKISAASDITAFRQHLDGIRYKVIVGSVILTLLTLLLALGILQRGLAPLKKLQQAAQRITRGEFTSIDEDGYDEISAPIRSFNLMGQRIKTLISDLQTEAENHRETEEKLKNSISNAEQHARHAEHQSKFLQMTLESIVDGVITTTIDGYVQTMNPMAEQLTGWTQEEARDKPLVLVMHALKEDTHKRIYDPTENIEYKTVLDEPVSALLIQKNSNIEIPVEYVAAPMRDLDNQIAGIVVIIHDESVQRQLNRQLTFQATHDALTGLINRYEFERRLKNTIIRQREEHSVNTLCYIDLDQFKLVNDTCGHTAGDELLKEITMLLETNLDGAGTLARLGGDEFGLLLENHNINRAQMIAGRLLMVIQQFQFSWNDNTFTIGASIGIAPISEDATSCEEILSNADSACYLAKENGRNRIQVYTDEDDKLLMQQREMHWVSRINHALEDNRFQLYFQEIMPLNPQEKSFILHGEILLRMIDREGDIVSPDNFLPAAEHYNMITLIDEWVVEQSIKWLATRSDKVLISINLSGMSLSNRGFLNFVVSRIKQHRVNPELLCFEITETAAISNLSRAIHFMNVLKKLGCSFALDDFGSGLSSFSYLTSLPVDYLKIDGSFVMDIDKDPMHYAMVKSINEVGQVMGIKTIAEFAASDAIIDCLKEVGLDHAQGYAVSRPVPLTSLASREPGEVRDNVISMVKNDQNAS